MNRPIYGTIRTGPGKSQYSCIYTLPHELDINTYLLTLKDIFTKMSKYNDKNNALDRIAIIETALQNVIAANTP